MNPDPDLLIAAAVAGELDEAGARALAALARQDPDVLRRLRLHLLIDEIAAQELLPSRGLAAFADGLAERRRAQDDGFAFLARVHARIDAEERVHALLCPPVATIPAAAVSPSPPPPSPPPLVWWPTAAAAALLITLLSGLLTAHTDNSAGVNPGTVLVQSTKEGLIVPFTVTGRP